MVIEHLRFLINEFSDEIPEEILSGRGDSKARRNWWQGVVGGVEQALDEGIIPEDLREEAESFLDDYTAPKFHNRELTTPADIGRANNLINKILKPKDNP